MAADHVLSVEREPGSRAARSCPASTREPRTGTFPSASRPSRRTAPPRQAWSTAPVDDFSYLGGVAQPVLVVNGSDDIVIPTLNSYYLYQHLANAELWLLPDSGHGAHFQYVDRFVGRVIDFLDVRMRNAGLVTW